MDENGTRSNGDAGGEWQAYSNYKSVTQSVAESINAALRSYAAIQSAHQEGAPVTAPEAAEARKNILAATLMLLGEMRAQEGENDYGEVLARWEGSDDGDDSDGFVRQLHEVRLTQECPNWLLNLVIDIRRVGWELGYLQAGRYEESGPRELQPRDIDELLSS